MGILGLPCGCMRVEIGGLEGKARRTRYGRPPPSLVTSTSSNYPSSPEADVPIQTAESIRMTAPQINDDRLPTTADLDKFKSCSLQDSTGKSHPISDLFEQASSNKTKLIVCFVRHFHCGFCLQYCSKICEHTAAKDPSLKIIVIGHGQSSAIQRYADLTGCAKAGIPVYTDPSKESFKALGVTKKTLAGPEGGKLPAYASGKSQLAMVWESLKETLGSGTQALKGGEYSQLGGEFVFDASGECSRYQEVARLIPILT